MRWGYKDGNYIQANPIYTLLEDKTNVNVILDGFGEIPPIPEPIPPTPSFEIFTFSINNTDSDIDYGAYFNFQYDYFEEYSFGYFEINPGEGLENIQQTSQSHDNRMFNYTYDPVIYPSEQNWTIKLTCNPIGAETINLIRNTVHRLELIDLKVIDLLDLSIFPNLRYLDLSYNKISTLVLPSTCSSENIEIYLDSTYELMEFDASALIISQDIVDSYLSIYNCNDLIFIKTPNGSLKNFYIYNNVNLSSITFGEDAIYEYIEIENNPSLTNLVIPTYNGPIFRLNLIQNISLGYINIPEIFPNLTNISGASSFNRAQYSFTDNNYDASTINKILYDINSISVAGYNYRSIIINGNASPDNSSGGIDGIAAKNALIAKGFLIQ